MLEVVYHLHTQNILSLEYMLERYLKVQMFDASLCGVSVSPDALRRFFIHSLTHTLTYRPRLKVSDAIAMQREWSFAKTCRLLTSLFRKLAVIFKVEELLSHLQQVLETHEVNWQHVLSCLSTLLVYNPNTQPSLKELLSRLLSSAFEGYDLENMITAFLLARQGALEGPGVFPSYSEWFKMSFGGASSYHGNSKKSLVFLLKFLSDLVPFDPPQYLKVHILHPPYVAVKHRALLQEYVSLTKTRLADLKVGPRFAEPVFDAGTSPRCQARQDVEKAISLFGSTGRISATVMEASIFRRPYFLSRFLPALLTPRVLPVKPDARMNFIDSLKKYFLTFTLSHTTTHHTVFLGRNARNFCISLFLLLFSLCCLFVPYSIFLSVWLFVLATLTVSVSHTVCPVFVQVVNMILRSFCQSLLDASRISPPNKQSPWASQFVNILLGHRQLLTALLHRMWDLLHNQGVSLSAAHVLGLAAFVVHLHASQTKCPKVQLCPPLLPGPVSVLEALTTALPCTTQTNMLFCVRWVRLERDPQHLGLHKIIIQYIINQKAQLMPDMRRLPVEASGESEYVGANKQGEEENCGLWKSVTDTHTTWRKSAWALWKHAPFRLLVKLPEYQFSFSEWLAAELRVQRSEDALSDPDRQEYQQWACQQLYLPSPVDKGGCAGDLRTACSHILNAVMDQKTVWSAGTCLPDIFSRLQVQYADLLIDIRSQRTQDKGHFLLDLISHRCSHWWGRLSPVLVSLWHRLTDGQPLPQQLQVLADCHLWVCSSKDGVSCPVPSASPLLLAACLHCVWEGQVSGKGIRTSLEMLGQLTEQHSQVSTLLFPITKCFKLNLDVCSKDSLAMFVSFDGVDTTPPIEKIYFTPHKGGQSAQGKKSPFM
uniref:Fanconi anaemia group A protein N-terminal domain-containing protein n=1 Tax=Oncorhynchus tshawytscha TaxID=74940 RepID=A0AAZ3Q7I9_ONCTS